jgi:hypothetical protein
VYDRLRVQSLKLEHDKCEYLRKEVYFWGYKFMAESPAMDEGAFPRIPAGAEESDGSRQEEESPCGL